MPFPLQPFWERGKHIFVFSANQTQGSPHAIMLNRKKQTLLPKMKTMHYKNTKRNKQVVSRAQEHRQLQTKKPPKQTFFLSIPGQEMFPFPKWFCSNLLSCLCQRVFCCSNDAAVIPTSPTDATDHIKMASILYLRQQPGAQQCMRTVRVSVCHRAAPLHRWGINGRIAN